MSSKVIANGGVRCVDRSLSPLHRYGFGNRSKLFEGYVQGDWITYQHLNIFDHDSGETFCFGAQTVSARSQLRDLIRAVLGTYYDTRRAGRDVCNRNSGASDGAAL